MTVTTRKRNEETDSIKIGSDMSSNNDRAEVLAKSFERAQQLTEIVGSKDFDRYAKTLSEGGFVDSYPTAEGFGQSKMLPYNPQAQTQQYSASNEMRRIQGRNGNFNSSRLPKAILEEIQSNPLDGLSSDPTMDAFSNELFDKIGSKPSFSSMIGESMAQSNENVIQRPSSSSGIDYDMLKMIVEGVVQKHIEPIKEKITLNESKGDGIRMMRMTSGNKFQFVDSDGNIFEATLTYKGNVSEMKKKKKTLKD